MAKARSNLFGFGESKVTYRRDVKSERAGLVRDAKQKARDGRDQAKKLVEQLKDDAFRAGESDRSDGKKMTPYRISLIASRYQDRIGRQKAVAMARSAYSSGYRKNPSSMADSAADLSEAWHGRPAKRETDYTEIFDYEDRLTDCGRLREVKVISGNGAIPLCFDVRTRLGVVPRGKKGQQAYFVGGDQGLSQAALKTFGIRGDELEKDSIPLGMAYSITYDAAKQHLEDGAEYGPWEHKFAEEGGVGPLVIYDRLNHRIGLSGGSYVIRIDIDGKYSAGIRD